MKKGDTVYVLQYSRIIVTTIESVRTVAVDDAPAIKEYYVRYDFVETDWLTDKEVFASVADAEKAYLDRETKRIKEHTPKVEKLKDGRKK